MSDRGRNVRGSAESSRTKPTEDEMSEEACPEPSLGMLIPEGEKPTEVFNEIQGDI